MASCEKCWGDAYRLFKATGKSQGDCYYELLKKRVEENDFCTPKEQAGQFWDEDKQIDIRSIEEAE